MLQTPVGIQNLLDSLYRTLLKAKTIERLSNQTEPHILDKDFHIDALIHCHNGMTFTVQEKVRDIKYLSKDQFTLEYMNCPGQTGEWFMLIADLYTYVYATIEPPKIHRGYMFWVAPFKKAVVYNDIAPSDGPIPNSQYGRANFYAFNFREFWRDWLMWSGSYPL